MHIYVLVVIRCLYIHPLLPRHKETRNGDERKKGQKVTRRQRRTLSQREQEPEKGGEREGEGGKSRTKLVIA